MPIEIRELVVRATVNQELGVDKGDSKSSSGQSALKREDVIADAIEQVIKILQEKTER